jgi:hypothetical protein
MYMTQFDTVKEDWSDILLLAPVDEETFQLALEDWDMGTMGTSVLRKTSCANLAYGFA